MPIPGSFRAQHASLPYKGVAPSFICVGWVGFPSTHGAPGDLLPTLLIPAVVTLLQEVAVLFDIVVVATGVTEAKTAAFRYVSRRIGRGGVSGCIYVISSSNKGRSGG
jgi:hypothetical protein